MQSSWMSRTLQGKRWLMEKRLEAVEQNDVDQLLELLSYTQCQPGPKELTSALETAILKKSDDYAQCIEILLAKGANPSATNGSGSPFLLLSADAGCDEVVHLLIDAKCDLNQTRDDGATALHRAAWNNHVKCVQMLLEAGADANIRDLQGRTALMLAAQANNMGVMMQMLTGDFKCDLNICDNMGRTLIYWAMLHSDENIEMLLMLVQAGCNVNVQDVEGCTPLMLACSLGDDASVEFLLLNGADVNLCDYDGDTALLLAAEGPHISCVRALLARGADVNSKNQEGATALLYLVDYPRIVAQMLSAGADVNLVTRHGVSPLWIATYNDSAESVRLLLKANCDPTQKAGFEEEKLPLQIALYDGSLAVVQLLFLATLAWGGDTKWLHQYLKDPTYLVNCRRYPRARKCKEWVEEELQYCDDGETLLNRCRRGVRQCLGCGSLGEQIQALPLPTPIRGYLDLKELDAVQCEAEEEYS